MRILVDADACPVKDEIERLASRRGIEVVHVCQLSGFKRAGAGVSVVVVTQGPDAADDWIAAECRAGDIVITQDVPLAAACVKLGAGVLNERGREMHENNASERHQMRDLMTALRDGGEMTRGPAPFTATDRRRFTDELARMLDRMTRLKPRPAAAHPEAAADAAVAEPDARTIPAAPAETPE